MRMLLFPVKEFLNILFLLKLIDCVNLQFHYKLCSCLKHDRQASSVKIEKESLESGAELYQEADHWLHSHSNLKFQPVHISCADSFIHSKN